MTVAQGLPGCHCEACRWPVAEISLLLDQESASARQLSSARLTQGR